MVIFHIYIYSYSIWLVVFRRPPTPLKNNGVSELKSLGMRKYDEIHSQLFLESHEQKFLGSKWFQTNQFPCSFEHRLPRGTSKILQVHGFRAGGHPLAKNVHLPWVPVIVQHVLWSQHVI